MRKNFLIYKNWRDNIDKLPDNEKVYFYNMLMEFYFDGVFPSIPSNMTRLEIFWDTIKDSVMEANDKYLTTANRRADNIRNKAIPKNPNFNMQPPDDSMQSLGGSKLTAEQPLGDLNLTAEQPLGGSKLTAERQHIETETEIEIETEIEKEIETEIELETEKEIPVWSNKNRKKNINTGYGRNNIRQNNVKANASSSTEWFKLHPDFRSDYFDKVFND